MPCLQNITAHIVPRLGEETTARCCTALGEGVPVATLLRQPVGTKPTEQDIIGAGVFGVQLQAVALEPLDLEWLAFDLLLLLRRDREAKDRQTAVLLPELADASFDAEPGLGETALAGLCERAVRCGYGEQRAHHQQQRNEPAHSSVHEFL